MTATVTVITGSAVIHGEHGAMPFPQISFLVNAIPPNDIRTRGNSDAIVFYQTGLQRNAKSTVKVNNSCFEQQNVSSQLALLLLKLCMKSSKFILGKIIKTVASRYLRVFP